VTWNVVLGPPGTGKTTFLLRTVESLFKKGIKPYELAYLAFTKKAANEALARAVKKFDYEHDQLIYFRTIHSLCYFWQGLTKSDVMDRKDLRAFSKSIGERISSAWDGENLMALNSKGDQMLFLENMARNMNMSYRDTWNQAGTDISWIHFDWFCKSYTNYKSMNYLMDFTDMLSGFLEFETKPPLKALIVDEAQDLSALQWKCVHRLAQDVEHVYIAGDDDQAIYKWAGADPEHFIELEGNEIYLEQSYRVPRKVHDVALNIVKRIRNRRHKTWIPREEEGSVSYHNSYEHIDYSEGDWLFLARNNYLLNSVEDHLRTNGHFYTRNNKSSVNENLLEAIKDWEQLRKGESVEAHKVKRIYNFMRAGKGVRTGYKTMKQAAPDLKVNINQLKKSYGLMVDGIWHQSFDLIGDAQREYIISCLRKGEKVNSSRIKLNTIHATKGGECENVVLLTDVANKTYEELYKTPDNECRAFYVGVTRTKENLHIIQGRTRKEFKVMI
jgi:DNA helicase-2/ATP-dependent DNA helicase PcrA